MLAGGHGVERGAGHAPGGADPPQARPDPCRARWRHSSPRPPPPQRAEGLRLGLQQFHLMVNLRSGMALSSSACTGSPLRCLSEASIPPIAFSRPARAGRSLRPTGATEVAPARHAKAAERSRLRATVHRWPSQRACRQSLAWGKRGRAKLARIYHRPINSNFLLKIIGHVPVLLGHFD